MTKPPMPKHPGRGLANPTVMAKKSAAPTTKTPGPQKPFNTHIPEPRWQRLISLVLIAVLVAFEVWFWVHRHK